MSDIHFGCENVRAVEATVAEVHAFAPTLTIISGDLTADGRREEFVAARAWLNRLPQPQIATPGNHDVPYFSLSGRLLSPFALYSDFVGPPNNAAAYLPGLTVRTINTARGVQPRLDWSKGAIKLAAVKKVANEMRVATKALKILVCHHPLVETKDAVVMGGVYRGAVAAGILAEAGVDLILTGHVHNPFAIAVFDVERGVYAVGAGTLSLRTRGTRPGFSTIEADADTIKVSSLAWTGSEFETATRWTLSRRVSPPVADLKVFDPLNPTLSYK